MAGGETKGRIFGTIGRIAAGLPTLVVLGLIAGIGWWGHHSGWKLPKLSDFDGRTAEKEEWCDEHNVLESQCVECNKGLLPKPESNGWCKIHGVHECTLCHPESSQLARPKVRSTYLERAERTLKSSDRSENNSKCKLHRRRIQLADLAAFERSGIDVEPVWTGPIVESIAASGDLGYDQTRVAHLSARVPGTVWKVLKHLGDDVKKGEVLALVDASEIGKAKADLSIAISRRDLASAALMRMKALTTSSSQSERILAEAEAREAELRVGASCQSLTNLGLPIDEDDAKSMTPEQLKSKLHFLGIPESIAKELEGKVASTNLLPMTAPMDGLIVSREVVAGEIVDVAKTLFEVVDTRSLWITLDVKSEDARRVVVDQKAAFRPDGSREELLGTIDWRSTQADPKTRTVKVRAKFDDPGRKQTTNTFGSGRILLREEPAAVLVPNEAVHWEGCCHIVFVRDAAFLTPEAPKVFHVRTVRLGTKNDTHTEIIAGVLPGEIIATKNSGTLRSELLRSNLGEGCGCHK